MFPQVEGLERYVPRVALEWERRVGISRCSQIGGTLLFVDISGFTNLSERLAARGRSTYFGLGLIGIEPIQAARSISRGRESALDGLKKRLGRIHPLNELMGPAFQLDGFAQSAFNARAMARSCPAVLSSTSRKQACSSSSRMR